MRSGLGRIGLYMRLSRDDEKTGVSIENQRAILQKYVFEHGGRVVGEYVDDGWSGTNFERPGVKRLLRDAREGRIDTIIVKDLSRFGRNYIEVGQYIDYIFPAYSIRFLALSDRLDTFDRNSAAMDMMPIMNVFNEWHAANTSKKIRAVFSCNQRAGRYTNWDYPYGYRAGTDEYRTAVVDEVAAKVVRRIFCMRAQGSSVRAIARKLTEERVENPTAYFTRLDGRKSARNCSPCWSARTVMWILTNQTYLGHTFQHKTTCVSYKNHKKIYLPKEEWIVKSNAHEAIVAQELWDAVQTVNGSVSRGRTDKTGAIHPLSGLLVCADCGAKLKRKSCKSVNGGKDCYICRTYADFGKGYCSSHRISEPYIEQLVLQEIRDVLDVTVDEKKVRKYFLCKAKRERTEGAFPAHIQREDGKKMSEYLAVVRKYVDCERLTRETCLQLIECITVGEKSENGKREVHIYYKFSKEQEGEEDMTL